MIREDDCQVTVSTPEFCYAYDKFTGLFTEMCYKNRTLLERPMEYNIWRAPTDNDRRVKLEWMRAQYDRVSPRAYETKVTVEEDRVKMETVLSLSAVYIQRILDIEVCWTVFSDVPAKVWAAVVFAEGYGFGDVLRNRALRKLHR